MQRNSLAILLDDNVVYNDYFRLLWLHVLHHHGNFIWSCGRAETLTESKLLVIKERFQAITQEVAQIDVTNPDQLLLLTKNFNQYKQSLLERIGLTQDEVNQDNLYEIILSTINTFNGYLIGFSWGVDLSRQLILQANKFLHQDVKTLMGMDYSHGVIGNFSHRHTPRADIDAAFRKGTTFYMADLDLLTQDLNEELQQIDKSVDIDKFPMRRILEGIEDESKFALLYAYANLMAKKNKDADLTIFVFEEDENVRAQIFQLFSAYKNALPNCQVLLFDNIPTSYYHVIDGNGPVDENFVLNLKNLLDPFKGKQKTVNLAAELLKDGKLERFLETRELAAPVHKMCGSRLFVREQNGPADHEPEERPSYRPNM